MQYRPGRQALGQLFTIAPCIMPNLTLSSLLNLLLLHTVLPDRNERRDTILAVVEQHNPSNPVSARIPKLKRVV